MSHNELLPTFRIMMLSLLSKILAVCLVTLLIFTTIQVARMFGFKHPLTIFGIGAAITVSLALADSIINNKISPFQWLALSVNFLLLTYNAMMLPTTEAIKLLENSGLKQNLLEKLFM